MVQWQPKTYKQMMVRNFFIWRWKLHSAGRMAAVVVEAASAAASSSSYSSLNKNDRCEPILVLTLFLFAYIHTIYDCFELYIHLYNILYTIHSTFRLRQLNETRHKNLDKIMIFTKCYSVIQILYDALLRSSLDGIDGRASCRFK